MEKQWLFGFIPGQDHLAPGPQQCHLSWPKGHSRPRYPPPPAEVLTHLLFLPHTVCWPLRHKVSDNRTRLVPTTEPGLESPPPPSYDSHISVTKARQVVWPKGQALPA